MDQLQQQEQIKALIASKDIRVARIPTAYGTNKAVKMVFTNKAAEAFSGMGIETELFDTCKPPNYLFNCDFEADGITAEITNEGFTKFKEIMGKKQEVPLGGLASVRGLHIDSVSLINPELSYDEFVAQRIPMDIRTWAAKGNIRKLETPAGTVFLADEKVHRNLSSYTPFDNLHGTSTCFESSSNRAESETHDFDEHPHQLKPDALKHLFVGAKLDEAEPDAQGESKGDWAFSQLVRSIQSLPKIEGVGAERL